METKNAMQWALALAIGVSIVVLGFKFAGWLLTTFFVINCLVLIIVVLLQSGKAADLAGAFGGAGSQTAFGPRGAANVLSKATTWCAVMFMLCALALFLRTDKAAGTSNSILEKFTHTTPAPAPVKSAAPATTPASTPASAPASTPHSTPGSTPAAPASSAPASGSQPASPPPATTPQASTPTKKP